MCVVRVCEVRVCEVRVCEVVVEVEGSRSIVGGLVCDLPVSSLR